LIHMLIPLTFHWPAPVWLQKSLLGRCRYEGFSGGKLEPLETGVHASFGNGVSIVRKLVQPAVSRAV
jgi:hypothetical protein